MDVEIAIRYSDDRPCTVTIAKPGGGELPYRIVTPRAGIPQSAAEQGNRVSWPEQASHTAGKKDS